MIEVEASTQLLFTVDLLLNAEIHCPRAARNNKKGN